MKKSFSILLISGSLGSFAQWESNVAVNNSVVVAAKSQNNVHITGDTKGGAIMAWDDNRNSLTTGEDIYAQRFTKGGVAKWAANGMAICTQTGTQRSSAITDAGDGSVIIAWEDLRGGNYDIYAQKIDSAGNALWAVNGVSLCSGSTHQKNPRLISDDAGGAIVVWEDSLNFYWDISAQRVSSVGAVMWGNNGVSICNASNSQINPRLDSDGSGGAIITWQDKRGNVSYDVYAQRVNASGAVQWAANGSLVCDALNAQTGPRVEPDGSGGVYIAWIDKRNGVDYDVYAQRLNSGGAVQWPTNGIAICNASGNQSAIDIKYTGTAGLMLAWKDSRTGPEAIYVQLVNASGTVQAAANGAKISNSAKGLNPNVVKDGSGGTIVAWQDSTAAGWNISAQRLNSSAIAQWASGGVIVSNASLDQTDVVQTGDLDGGAIFAWQDNRSGSNNDIYVQHLNSDGSSAVGIQEFSHFRDMEVICYPNPVSGNSVIRWSGNKQAQTQVRVYDIHGRLMDEEFTEGNTYQAGRKGFLAGTYFFTLIFDGEGPPVNGKFVVAE